MSFSTLFRHWRRSTSSFKKSPARTHRPRIDVLEDRTVPATLNVNPAGTGGAFTTIQAAITASADGDTIEVAPGRYQEIVNINKQVTLLGANAGITGYGQRINGESVVDANNSGTAFLINANNVTIDGFMAINAGTSDYAGVVVTAAFSNASIVNNIIANNTKGISLAGTTILVQGNIIANNNATGAAQGSGIYSDAGSANVTIVDNRFNNNSNASILFAPLAPAIASNPLNPLRNQNLVVARNTAFDRTLGIFTDITNGVITDNYFQSTAPVSTLTGNIRVTGGVIGLTISNNDLIGGTHGVRVNTQFDVAANQNIVISTGNQFFNHTVAGVEVEAGAVTGTVDVTRNWWNSSTGPTNALNPAGTGELLIAPDGNATFDKFAITPHYVVQKAGVFLGLTQEQAFVQNLYIDALGRAGGRSELDGWVQSLSTNSRASVALAIETSLEARTQRVKSWYQNYLGRTANNGEEQTWVQQLQSTVIKSEERVLSVFLSSEEFYARAQTLVPSGTADERYVQALYRALLGREGGPSELTQWVNQLPTAGRAGVVFSIVDSTEARTRRYENYYNVLLERAADPAGLESWVNSAFGDLGVRLGLEASAEFFALD